MRKIKHTSYYRAALDMPPDPTPCHCDDCDWRGAFADLNVIDDCMLTPGDPSPAGRCPQCDTLAYIDQHDLEALMKETLAVASSLQEMLEGFMRNPSEPERHEKAKALRLERRLSRLQDRYNHATRQG
jgi:hypothetical protein